MLANDPAPKFIHLDVGKDPRTGVAILWRTNDEATLATTVQYGVNGATDNSENGFTFVYDLNAPTADGISTVRMHETHLCGLAPDTEYTYRVGGIDGNGKEAWSPTYTFRTLPMDPNAEVTMLVIGDTRDGYSTWGNALAQAFAKMQPDIILFNGDGTTLGPIQDEWEAWFQAASPELPLAPMILAHGNHDVSAVNWFSQFAMPGDEQNFAVDFGAVHLTVANDTPDDIADLTGTIAQTLDTNLKAGMSAPLEHPHAPQADVLGVGGAAHRRRHDDAQRLGEASSTPTPSTWCSTGTITTTSAPSPCTTMRRSPRRPTPRCSWSSARPAPIALRQGQRLLDRVLARRPTASPSCASAPARCR